MISQIAIEFVGYDIRPHARVFVRSCLRRAVCVLDGGSLLQQLLQQLGFQQMAGVVLQVAHHIPQNITYNQGFTVLA